VSIRAGNASGTGFLVDNTQTVVTNAHVVESAGGQVTVRFGSDGRDISAQVVGADPSSDLAVIHLPSGSAPADAKPLALAESNQVKVGDQVIAIGNPFGLDRTATEGIVSGLGRSIQAPNGFQIDDAIQTDAPINPGNSGGPLLDDSGRVVGVNSQIETGGTSNGNLGIGFAVPSDAVRTVVPQLERGVHIKRAWLGISTSTTPSAGGARVGDVTAGGPAAAAGVQQGDVITAIDDQQVSTPTDVAKAVGGHKPGDHIKLHMQRPGGDGSVDVTLGTRPAQVP
jgi:putative serine protease PepD